MASENIRKKLKQLLERGSNKDTFKEDIKWLQSINSWINFHCPTLQNFCCERCQPSLATCIAQP